MNIEEILKSLGINIYEDVGDELRIECPFCHSPHKKGYVNKRSGLNICYNCGFKSNFTGFIMKLTGNSSSQVHHYLRSNDFADWSVTKVENETDNPLAQLSIAMNPDDSVNHLDINRLSMPRIPSNCFYLMDNFNNREAFPFFNYSYKRGITLNDIKKYHISYVKHGYFIKRDGTKSEIDNSLVFFAYNKNAQPIYWNSRAINNFIQPKSINAPALKGQRSRKETVFNLNSIKPGQNVYMAEGVFNSITLDHMSSNSCGICTYGKQVTSLQVANISHTKFSKLYICLDSDAFDNAWKVYNMMMSAGIPRDKTFIVDDRLLGTKDWNDIGPKESAKLIQQKAFRPSFENKLKEMIE